MPGSNPPVVSIPMRIGPLPGHRVRRLPDPRPRVFLEQGSEKAGLRHVMSAHGDQFAAKGVDAGSVPDLLMKALKENDVVAHQGRPPGRPVYQTSFRGRPIRVAITVGSNGFIVGANVQ